MLTRILGDPVQSMAATLQHGGEVREISKTHTRLQMAATASFDEKPIDAQVQG